MDCPEQETIEHYISGRLEASKLAEFEVHLGACGRCKTKLAEARENENLLSELRLLGTTTSSGGDSVTTQTVFIGTVERAQELLGSKYRVVRMVGRGGAGEVFQTIDPILDRQVAIKFLTRKDTAEKISKQRWQEARLLGQLNHPNVAQVYGIGESESGVRYIVMEWVEGLLLTDAWREMGLQQRLGLYLQVLDGISAAHKRGIIHRDIKPSNILVTAANKAKVLDFGIAVDEQPLMSADEGRYRGTPAFSAPEQITTPVDVSPATDVFALGILLYDMLTDTLPFDETDPVELFDSIKNKHPELPSAIQEKIPIALQNICLKALEKNPHRRYRTARDLLDDINRYLRGEKVWSRPSFLLDKVQQEVFYHRQKLKVWHDNELITQREYDKLESIYERVISPDDPSIIEARKLSLSQVCLYLGGWIAVLGSFVLFYKTWDQIPIYWRPAPAIAATVLMVVFGLAMWRRKESRLSVGFLATANLLIPITILLTLGQWEILSAYDFSWGKETIYHLLKGAEIHVIVGNMQLYLSSWCWLAFSLLFLRITKSSIFMLFSIIAFLIWLTTCYVIGGMEDWKLDIIAGRYLFPGIGMFVLGAVLDRRKYTQYAWPPGGVGLAMIVITLSVIAISDQTLFGWIYRKPEFLKEYEHHLLSFMCNGIIYLGLAYVCRALGTRFQRALAQVLSWLGPLHFLAVLRILDLDQLGLPHLHRMFYRFLLPVASLAFVFGSVVRQMKSFFFSGLIGIAAAVHKFTVEHLDKFFAWPVSLIITGIVWMLVSWLVPRWKASVALKRQQ